MVERQVTLKFEADGAVQVVNATNRIGAATQRTAKQADDLSRSGRSLTNTFKNFGTQLLLVPQALLNTGRLLKSVATTAKEMTVGLIETGGALADTAGAFDNLQKKGIETARVLDELRSATQGQVNDLELQRVALSAFSGEATITTDQLTKLVSAIFATGKGLGRELRPTLEQLRTSLAGMSLSTLGSVAGFENIVPAIERAKIEASKAGKTFDRVAEFTYGMELALFAAEKQMEQYSGSADSAGDTLQRLTVDIENLVNNFKLTVVENKRLQDAMVDLERFFQLLGETSDDLATILGTELANGLALVLELIPTGLVAFQRLYAIMSRMLSLFVEIVLIIPKVTGVLTDLFNVVTFGAFDAKNALGDFGDILQEVSIGLNEQANEAEETATKYEGLIEQVRRAREETNRARQEQASENAEAGTAQLDVNLRVDEGSVERALDVMSNELRQKARPAVQRILAEEQALLNAQAAGT